MINMFWTDPEGAINFLPDIVAMKHDEDYVTIWFNGKISKWNSDGFPEDAEALIERWKRCKMLVAGLQSEAITEWIKSLENKI